MVWKLMDLNLPTNCFHIGSAKLDIWYTNNDKLIPNVVQALASPNNLNTQEKTK